MNSWSALRFPKLVGVDKGCGVLWISALLLTLWVIIPAWMDGSQLNDSLEQLIWGQSLEWGYWKHPPLTSWLVWLATWVVPQPYLSTYLLGLICTLLTLWFTWWIGVLLFDKTTADLTAVMMTLHYGFTRRAAVYNHNTVLLCLVALCVLLLLIAMRRDQLRWWVMLGLASGAAMLTKYQAGIPMVGIFGVLLVSGQATKHGRQLLVAALVAMVVVSPHVYWMYQHHFETIGYAMSYAQDELLGESVNARLSKFLGGQLRFVALSLAFVLAAMWSVRGMAKAQGGPTREQRHWLIGLVGVPLVIFVVLAIVFRVKLQSYWGLQTSQFVPLLLAVWLRRASLVWGDWYNGLWLGLACSSLLIFFAQESAWISNPSQGAELKGYPAKQIAMEAVSYWHARTNCPLMYVSGEMAPAAMVAAYASDANIRVLQDSDFAKSPWIQRDDMELRGFLEVHMLKDQTQGSGAISHVNQYRPNDVSIRLNLIYHAPQTVCSN
jgi:hypothetical protein